MPGSGGQSLTFEFFGLREGIAGEGNDNFSFDDTSKMYNNAYTKEEIFNLAASLSVEVEWVDDWAIGDEFNYWVCFKKRVD